MWFADVPLDNGLKKLSKQKGKDNWRELGTSDWQNGLKIGVNKINDPCSHELLESRSMVETKICLSDAHCM